MDHRPLRVARGGGGPTLARLIGALCSLAAVAAACGPVVCPSEAYGGATVTVQCHGVGEGPAGLTAVNATANATVSTFEELACMFEHVAGVVGRGIAVFVTSPLVEFPRPIAAQGIQVAVFGSLDSGAKPQLTASNNTRLLWLNASFVELHGLVISGGKHEEVGGAMNVLSSDLVLDNVRLENNSVTASSLYGNKGGALYFTSSSSAANVMPSLTIRDSVVANNSVSGAGVPVFGGAIGIEVAADTAVSFTATSSTFRDNFLATSGSTDAEGGAIGVRSIGSGGGAVQIADVRLSNNRVSATRASRGGALHVDGDPTRPYNLDIYNTTFTSNTAMFGGAVSIIAGASVDVKDSTFELNNATRSGGAMFGYQVSPWEVRDSVAEQNQAAESGGFLKAESGSSVMLYDIEASFNRAGGEGGVLAATGGSFVDLLISDLTGNIAPNGSAVFVWNSEWSCLDSTVQGSGQLVEAQESPTAIDRCILNATTPSSVSLTSDDVIGLRNSQVIGAVVTSSSGRVLSCADASGTYATMVGCAPQYCKNAPGALEGVSCYCDTDLGPRDPTWEGCEEPAKIQVLQSSFKLFSDKPDAVETVVFFTNGGDDDLSWSVEVKDYEPGHSWEVLPTSGNLSTCNTANFSLHLAAANKSSYSDFFLSLELSSNTYPYEVDPTFLAWNGGRKQILEASHVPRNTTVTIAVDYFLRAEASAVHSTIMLVANHTNTSSRAAILNGGAPTSVVYVAGDRVEGYIEARDADNLPIIGSGGDDFQVRLERVVAASQYFVGDPVVCEVVFEPKISLHKYTCDASSFYYGEYQVVATLAPSGDEVGQEQFGVRCAEGFLTSGNGTCGCSPGSRLNVARESCMACSTGRYGVAEASIIDPNPCLDCRGVIPGSVTIESGLTNSSGCTCPPAFFLYDRRMPDDNDDAPPVLRCEDAPDGASADKYGTGVHDLNIKPGHWRVGTYSAAILECEDPTPCVGSNASDNLCIENTHGPYCSVCVAGYVKDLTGECTKCTSGDESAVTVLAVILFIVMVAAVGVSFVFLSKKNQKSKDLFDKVEGSVCVNKERLSVGLKTRNSLIMKSDGRRTGNASLDMLTAYTAYQASGAGSGGGGGGGSDTADRILHTLRIVAQELQFFGVIGNVFRGPMPSAVRGALKAFGCLNLDFVSLLRLGCAVDGWNFYHKLVATTLWPLGAFFLCLCLYVIGACSTGRLRVLQTVAAEVSLLFIFCVYTTVANVVFATWECEDFPDSSMSRLKADYSLECNTAEHTFYSNYATAMLLLYPLGVPLIFVVIIWNFRDRLSFKYYMRRYHIPAFNNNAHLGDKAAPENTNELYLLRNSDPVLAPIHFLYFEYTNKCYWFECVECMRKMLLAGVLTFIWPGSALQIMTGMFIAMVLFGFTAYMRPHVHPKDSVISSISQFCTFWLLFTLLIQKAAPGTPAWLINLLFYFCIIVPLCTAAVAILLDMRDFLNKRKDIREAKRLENQQQQSPGNGAENAALPETNLTSSENPAPISGGAPGPPNPDTRGGLPPYRVVPHPVNEPGDEGGQTSEDEYASLSSMEI